MTQRLMMVRKIYLVRQIRNKEISGRIAVAYRKTSILLHS